MRWRFISSPLCHAALAALPVEPQRDSICVICEICGWSLPADLRAAMVYYMVRFDNGKESRSPGRSGAMKARERSSTC
jgi:hypothetical protein